MALLTASDASLRPLFVDQLGRHRDVPALVTDDDTISYAELDERVRSLAARIGSTRRLVTVAADNTVGSITAYLAALRGHHPVLLVPASDAAAVEMLCAAYDPDVIIADGWLDERRAGTRHELHPDLALLLSTSGSTGAPKLVRLSRQNVEANTAAIAAYLSIGPQDRAITTLPMQYCYGLSVINSHLRAGATVVLTALSVMDACFWDLFTRSGATTLAGVPHTFDLLDHVGFASMDLPTLRYITQAGGRLHPDTVRRYTQLGADRGWQLFVMYGQTEATARMAYLPPELAATHPHTIGVAIPGGAFTIDGCDDNGVGELVYRGPNVMLGYAERPDDLALGRTVDELRTGDLARWAGDELVEIVGRRRRFIKPFGLRIDLDHLESHLCTSGVAALCTGDDNNLIVAIEHSTDLPTVTALVENRLHLPPSRVQILQVAELPRLATGKPDYETIRSRADEARHARDVDATASDDVRAAFAEILDVDPDYDDCFATLGGDSLSYVEMSIRLEQLIGKLPRDWHTRPIRDLAQADADVPRRHRRFAPVETTVVLRAAAIVLIVGTHTRAWYQPGGAHALLALAGYNFARFQLAGGHMLASIARIAVPSACWIAIVVATTDGFAWPHVLLVNDLFGGPDARWAYWFIEALVQTLVLLAVVFAIPAVARLERHRPFLVAAVAVGAGLVVRFDIVDLTTDHRISRPQNVFWLFALGWAATHAASWPKRALVTAVAVVSVAGFFGDPHRELIVAAAIALVVWVPTMPLPRLAVGAVAKLAGASLYIYLTHFQIYPNLTRSLGPAAAAAASLAVGVAAWLAAQRLITYGERTARRRLRRTTNSPPSRSARPHAVSSTVVGVEQEVRHAG